MGARTGPSWRGWRWVRLLLAAGLVCLAGWAALPGLGRAQKYGGVLKTLIYEQPASYSILEESTVPTNFSMLPVYNNLVVYNPLHAVESGDDIVGELAESWRWSQGFTRLAFTLRRGVTWHDGQPFTSADVKETFDRVSGASGKHMRLNPRKLWFANLAAIETAGDYEVAFVLKRPQPALLALLASSDMPVYPAHRSPEEQRLRPMGTGPFRFKQALADERIVLERNPAYFVKGRPYLDGIEYIIIKSRPSRYAALQTGQVDAFMPIEGSPTFRDATLALVPTMVVREVAQTTSDDIIMNTRKPPFDNATLRQAVNHALNRAVFIRSVLRGGGVRGGALLPRPYGPWGLPDDEVAKLPGMGNADEDKARARLLLAQAGYGPQHPLRVNVSVRNIDTSVDSGTWVVAELRSVGVDAVLETVESAQWYAKLARRDFTMGSTRPAWPHPIPMRCSTSISPATPNATTRTIATRRWKR